jgi:hypothetical protein
MSFLWLQSAGGMAKVPYRELAIKQTFEKCAAIAPGAAT